MDPYNPNITKPVNHFFAPYSQLLTVVAAFITIAGVVILSVESIRQWFVLGNELVIIIGSFLWLASCIAVFHLTLERFGITYDQFFKRSLGVLWGLWGLALLFTFISPPDKTCQSMVSSENCRSVDEFVDSGFFLLLIVSGLYLGVLYSRYKQARSRRFMASQQEQIIKRD